MAQIKPSISLFSNSLQSTPVPRLQRQSESITARSWVEADPARWNTFVPNSLSQIQSMLSTTEFIHVPSEEKSADMCSRGLLASQLVGQQKFWFKGLSSFPVHPHTLLTKEEACREVKSITVLASPSNALVNGPRLFQITRKVTKNPLNCKVAFKKVSRSSLVGKKWLAPNSKPSQMLSRSTRRGQ